MAEIMTLFSRKNPLPDKRGQKRPRTTISLRSRGSVLINRPQNLLLLKGILLIK